MAKGKKKSSIYSDTMPSSDGVKPIAITKGHLFNVDLSTDRPVGDTGSASYVGDSFTPSGYDDVYTYEADLAGLDDIRAGNQGALSSLGNSAAKFVGKTLNNVVGGTIGTLYGLGDAAFNGDVSKIWDNSFTAKLDEVDKGLNDIFKVYRTSDYENQNILQRAFLHPLQFTDDTADALSFTAGAVVTELLTSGVGSASILPKGLKYMKFLSRGAEAAEATANLASTGRRAINAAGDAGLLAKRLATGAAYESTVEARQATIQLRDKLYNEWEANNPGTEMPEEVASDIDDRLSKAGLFTYLTNLALVGSSNIIQFPKIFGLGARSSSRIAEGAVARNAVTGAFESTAAAPTRLEGILSRLKNPAYEGLVEEGGQNVLSNTAQDYWSQKEDPSSKEVVNDFLQVFADNVAKTYTTKEGWNDIGMGILIGGLGAPGRGILSALGKNNALGKVGFEEVRDETGNVVDYKRQNIWEGGVFGADTQANAEKQQIQKVVDRLNRDTNLFTSMKRNYDTLVRNQVLENKKDAALEAGDLFEFNNAKDDQIHNYISSRIEAGLSEDLDDTISSMRKLSPEDFYTSFRGEEDAAKLSDGQKAQFQMETIKAFENRVANTKSAVDIIDGAYKGNNNDLREELIHAVATTKNIDTRESEINNELAKLSEGVISNRTEAVLGDQSFRESGTQSVQQVIDDLSKDETKQTPEIKDFIAQLKSVRNKTLTPTEVNLLLHFAKIRPTDFYYNKAAIINLLEDSRKLRKRRQQYLDLYNTLFTAEGQQAFQDYQTKQAEAAAKEVEKEVAKEDKKVEDKARVENTKKVVKKAAKVKVEPVITPTATTVDETPIATDDIPNVNFDEFDDEVTTNSPVVDNVSTEDTLDAEEEVVVKVEETKASKTKKDKPIEVRNPEEADENFEDLEYINLDLKRSIANTITYLGVNYNKEFQRSGDEVTEVTNDVYDENGNLSINEFVDTKLFSSDYYKPGQSVRLIIPSFTQMQARGLQNYTQTQYNNDINNAKRFPIAILNDDSQIIGYLPTQSGIDRLIQDEYKDIALKANQAIRDKIFNSSNTEFRMTITSKSPGMVMRNAKANQQSLFEALGDGNSLANKVSIGIGQNGLIKLNKGSNFDGKIINQDSIKDGLVYSIVPSSQEDVYVAVPMKVSQVGDDQAQLLLAAIQAFGNPESTSSKASLNNITEYDFTNLKDINDFIGSIIYATSALDSNDRNYFKLSKTQLILSKTNEDMKYMMFQVLNDKDVQAEIINILSKRYRTVDINKLNDRSGYISYDLADNGTIVQLDYKNYQDYLNTHNIITSNINKIRIEGNNYVFTAQPVIGLGDGIQEVQEAVAEGISRPVVESEVAKTTTQRKTTRTLFDPTKVKPKPLEDLSPEFIEAQNIKSGEDLRKKCL